MRKRTKIALGVIVALGLFIELLWWLAIQPAPDLTHPIAVTFLGYTNPPAANFQRFARLVISNQSPIKIQLFGDSIQVEGKANSFPRFSDSRYPESCRLLRFKMKPGEAFILPVRVPDEAASGARWKYSLPCASQAWRDDLFDFALRYKLPTGWGRFQLSKYRKFFNNEGPWLGAETNAAPLLSLPATNPPPATNLIPHNAWTNRGIHTRKLPPN